MMDSMSRKVTASQLSRDAFVYVRQSTMRQVAENQESTRRQYALRERATALGWTPEQIAVESDGGSRRTYRLRRFSQRLPSTTSYLPSS